MSDECSDALSEPRSEQAGVERTLGGQNHHKEGYWDTEIERTVLEATIDADTSLFEIDAVDATDNRIVVTDILSSGEEVSIVDINLSQTAKSGVLLFFRPVRYEEFIITSGSDTNFSVELPLGAYPPATATSFSC